MKKKDSDFKTNLNRGGSFFFFQKIRQQAGPAASASYNLLASILVFTLIGWYFDEKKGTSPSGVLIGITFGLVVGFYHLLNIIWTKKK